MRITRLSPKKRAGKGTTPLECPATLGVYETMSDHMLRALVLSLEEKNNGCPLTLILSSAVVVGIAVKRERFLEELGDLAKSTSRPILMTLARDVKEIPEAAGEVVHLLSGVVISGGQAVDSALTSPDRHTINERPADARARRRRAAVARGERVRGGAIAGHRSSCALTTAASATPRATRRQRVRRFPALDAMPIG